MIIVHLIDHFQPKVGYQETFLAKENIVAGHDVYVVTSDKLYPFPNYDRTYKKILGSRKTKSGYFIEYDTCVVRLQSVEIPFTHLVFLRNLSTVLRRIKPHLVICHGMYGLTPFMVALLKDKLKFKLIYDTHSGHFNTDFKKSFLKRIYLFLYQRIAVPTILKNKDAIFAVGDDEQSFLCENYKIGKKDVPVIRLGVDINKFKFSNSKRVKIRKLLQIKRNQILLICTGKITENKDVDILIKAVESIPDHNIKLLIVGNGDKDYMINLKSRINSKGDIFFKDMVINDDLPSYYSAADIGIWPGDTTITIPEAISTGLPAILPSWMGNKYLDKSGGVLKFPRGNAKDLSEKIRKLAYNNSLRKKMGTNSRKFAKKNLSWRIIAGKVLFLINNNDKK
jgi:glycosyltransferase involved in cell wall biosynthesis